ncbi:PREDICTED: protein SMAX1-LIKE 2 [Camelina sativa]|uniref:Protein SMAX1-LIKE 2 n=1 Tax=Camelina sativa TaxID=90675 RepID=A0ABM0UA72_CAMSA|nr:PREDICTED: protein SMAX1-LIKE 2 [Camelina sativa]
MRADLVTIQQTLTPEAATVLNQSIAEATRRNHGHTTPLHVAATLLSSSSGYLRQACIKSHPNSSHPLQCRALELCFSVALERLPTTSTTTTTTTTSSSSSSSPSQTQEPLLSNALTAALKRAQAHQRRGCPEQQQQPLLAVKVELEQLIISILDDPSVSRVMREASFSSPAVKSAIEQSLVGNSVSSNSRQTGILNPSSLGFGYRSVPTPVNRNLYLNPRLQQQHGVGMQSGMMMVQRTDETKRVIEIMIRTRKRNPVLVGDSEPHILVKEILEKIENGEFADGPLRDFQVIRLEKELVSQLATRFGEISGLIETRIGGGGGVVLDLGDLKWLVEHPAANGGAVTEMRKLLERYKGRLCFIGTATCETYLRCQVYYPSMENDWDLQAMPIAAKSSLPAMFPRLGSNNNNNNNTMLLSNNIISIESISPTRSFQIPMSKMSCCSRCLESYENDVAKVEKDLTGNNRSVLPQWLQNAKANNDDGDKKLTKDQQIVELQKKWNDLCSRLHSNQSVSERIVSSTLPVMKLNSRSDITPPGSPVRTDLVLGRANRVLYTPEKKTREGCFGKLGDSFDIDLFKKLLKGLAKSVWWQNDAASSVAAAITECKHGNGKSKGDIWLMFTGPDRAGKSKMAYALSDLVSGSQPITISLGSRSRTDGGLNLRGKTALDRFAEAVRRNPFAVIVLEDIDEADVLLRNNVKLAMERGRISDSHGREVSLGNVIIILTANSSFGSAENVTPIDETRLESLVVSKGWQLRLSVCNSSKNRKRKPNWLYSDNEQTKQRKEICFDLNEAAEFDSSSDVTVEHDQEDNNGNLVQKLVALADDTILFRPVDFDSIKNRTAESLKKRFSNGPVDGLTTVEIEDDALERIAGAIWLSKISLEEWVEEAMGSSLNTVKSRVSYSEDSVIRIELEDDLSDRISGGYLPSSIRTVIV